MTSELHPLVWLITGCSSGFGTSLATIALKAGHKVIATSRNPSNTPSIVKKIEDLGGIWLKLDVTGSLDAIQKVVNEGTKHFGRIDVLVNNAGIALLGSVEDFSLEEINRVMSTNFHGPLSLIQAVLPQFRAQKSGVIVNISSAAGIDPLPSMSIYGASKFALEGLSQGLAKEVAPFGIRVLIVQPGSFTTGMMNSVTLTDQFTEAYREYEVGKFMGQFAGNPEERAFTSANDVEKGCRGIFEVVTGTGRGEGKEAQMRLLLSADVAERAKGQTSKVLNGYEAFRDIWSATGHDGGVKKAFAVEK